MKNLRNFIKFSWLFPVLCWYCIFLFTANMPTELSRAFYGTPQNDLNFVSMAFMKHYLSVAKQLFTVT